METGNTVTGEGEWVQNTAFGEDTYTSNKYSRADGEAVAPIIYDGNAAAERTPLEAVYADAAGNTLKADGTPYTAADADATRVPGALRVATDADGQWLAENLPTVYVSDEDKYYLASYRVELADLYREPSNGVDGTVNQWVLTRYHHDGVAEDDANCATINGSKSVTDDSDVAATAYDEAHRGIVGGMVIGSRVAADTTGVASDGTAVDGTAATRTTRSHDGQIILAWAAQDTAKDEHGNYTHKDANAFVELPAGEGMGEGVEIYDWIADPETMTVTDEATGETAEVVRPVEAGDVGQVEAPRQAVAGYLWNDADNDGIQDAGEAPEAGRKLALERFTVTATQQADGSFAVAHGGWRGCVGRIASAAVVDLAATASADASEVNVYIGPHIGPCCFEVGDDVAARFRDAFGPVCMGPDGRHVSMAAAIRADLAAIGIDGARVAEAGMCTQCHSEQYFSSRASGGRSGRHGALACRLER